MADSKAGIDDAPFYATAEIRGTRCELIRLSVSEEIGITNLDNGKLGKDQYLSLSAVRLLYDKNSPDGKFTDPYPAALLNGEWELELGGKKEIAKMPIRRFFDGFFGYNVGKPFGFYALNNPKWIKPQTPIELNVDLKNELDGYLKVEFYGTVSNNK